jgi:hypothetical protein
MENWCRGWRCTQPTATREWELVSRSSLKTQLMLSGEVGKRSSHQCPQRKTLFNLHQVLTSQRMRRRRVFEILSLAVTRPHLGTCCTHEPLRRTCDRRRIHPIFLRRRILSDIPCFRLDNCRRFVC